MAEKIVEVKQTFPLSNKVEKEEGWSGKLKQELIQVVMSYNPEQVCTDFPHLIEGKFPDFSIVESKLQNMDTIDLIFIKNILSNKWDKK